MDTLSKTYTVMTGEKGLSALLKIKTLWPKYSLINLSAHLFPDGSYLLIFPEEERIFPFSGDSLEIKTDCLSDSSATVVDAKTLRVLLWAKFASPLKEKAERLAKSFIATAVGTAKRLSVDNDLVEVTVKNLSETTHTVVEKEKNPKETTHTAVGNTKSLSEVKTTAVGTVNNLSVDNDLAEVTVKNLSDTTHTAVGNTKSLSEVKATAVGNTKSLSEVKATAVGTVKNLSVDNDLAEGTVKNLSETTHTAVEKEKNPKETPLDAITEICIDSKENREIIFEGLGERLEYLLENYPPCTPLNSAYEDSRWVEVKEEDCSYVVGVLYNASGVTTVCYGIKGEYNKKPPKGGYEWLPTDVNKWEEEGYWIIYQQIESLLDH